MRNRSKKRKAEPKKSKLPGSVTFSYASESLERQKNYVKPSSKFSVARKSIKKFLRKAKQWHVPKYVKTDIKNMRRLRRIPVPKIKPVKIRMSSTEVIIVSVVSIIVLAFLVLMVCSYFSVQYRPDWW